MAFDAEILAELRKLNSNLSKSGGAAPTVSLGGEEVSSDELQQRQVLYDQILNSAKATKEISETQKKINLNNKDIKEQELEIRKAIAAGDAARAQSLGEELKTLNELNVELEKQKQLIREANDEVKSLSDSFANIFGGPGAVKVEDIFSPKAIGGVISGLSKIAKTQQLSTLAHQSATKAGSIFLETVVKTSMALADGEAKFMKATGASKEFARSVTDSYETTREFGATMEETSAAYQTLFTTFTDFTMLSKAQRESLAETSTLMAKLGISNDDFAKSVLISTKSMGMSSEQAGQNMEDLAVFAQQLGVAPQQLAADFAGAGDMMAKMGDQGTKAFKDLAIIAKTTSMSIESIVNLTNKFDTFEGAADQAGKLNAALGGNFVNAMDLMMATNPAERFEMIRDSLLDTGMSFDDMSYFQKNFYKDSLGLSDVGELAALMSGDMDLVANSTEKTSQELIDSKKRAHEMATMTENLNTALANMIPIITPLIDGLKSFTEYMASNKEAANFLGKAIGAVIVVMYSYKAITKASALATAAITTAKGAYAFVTGLLASAKGAENLATEAGIVADTASVGPKLAAAGATTTAGAAAAVSAPQMLALGFAALMVGGAIAIAALGFAELAKSLVDLNGPQLVAFTVALIAFGVGLNAVLASLGALVGSGVGLLGIAAVLAIGAAALAMGYGIKLAAEGMAELVKSFAGLKAKKIYAIGAAMGAFAGSVVAFALAAMMIANPLALAGIAVLTVGILGMAYALTLVEDLIVNVATAFASLFATIANPQTASNIKQISEAIQAIPARKNIEFATSMSALAAANTAAAALGAVNAVTATVTGVTPAAQTTKQEVYKMELPIMLDGKEIDRKIVELIGGAARDASAGRAR